MTGATIHRALAALLPLTLAAAAPAPPASHPPAGPGADGSPGRPATAPSATERFRELVRSRPAALPAAFDADSATGDDAKAFRAWLAANAESVGVGPPPAVGPAPSGAVTYRPAAGGGPAKLYLHVLDHHASGKVIAYGLSGDNVKRAYWLGDPKRDLKIEKTPRDTLVELTAKNAKAPDPLDTVAVLELAGEPKLNPLAVPQRADGSVLLHAKESVVVGRNLRYEPEPHKDTVGYWTNPADWVYWELSVEKPGTFEVEMLQGCGKNSGGSEVEVTIDGRQPLPMTVQDTGHFQNFVPRVIGRVTLDAGRHTLAVKVKRKKGAAVMDLRQVTLKPAP